MAIRDPEEAARLYGVSLRVARAAVSLAELEPDDMAEVVRYAVGRARALPEAPPKDDAC